MVFTDGDAGLRARVSVKLGLDLNVDPSSAVDDDFWILFCHYSAPSDDSCPVFAVGVICTGSDLDPVLPGGVKAEAVAVVEVAEPVRSSAVRRTDER